MQNYFMGAAMMAALFASPALAVDLTTSTGRGGGKRFPQIPECGSTKKTAHEVAICGNEPLGVGNKMIASAFRQAKAISPDATNAMTRGFLRDRQACGDDVDCIDMRQTEALAAYEALGANLSIATEEAGPHCRSGNGSFGFTRVTGRPHASCVAVSFF